MTPDFDAIARQHGIRLLLQFGSTVSAREHAQSDVDVGVLLERSPTTLDEWTALAADLQRCFPDRELDLAIINRADPLFLKQIVEGGRLLYGSPRAFAELKIYAFKRYQDHRRFLAMEREYVTRTIAALR